jgi:hypothetical protein
LPEILIWNVKWQIRTWLSELGHLPEIFLTRERGFEVNFRTRSGEQKRPGSAPKAYSSFQNGHQIIVGRFGRFRLRRFGVSLFLSLSAM